MKASFSRNEQRRRIRWRGLLAGSAILAGLAFGTAHATFAIELSWLLPIDGNFSDGIRWSGGSAPGLNDTAIFDAGGSYTVTFSQLTSNDQAEVTSPFVKWDLGGHTYNLFGFGGQPLTVDSPSAGTFAALQISNGTVDASLATLPAVFGDQFNAEFIVDGNATLQSDSGGVGRQAGSQGFGVVAGAWSVTRDLTVGDAGIASTDVISGGQVQADEVFVGRQASSAATLQILGTSAAGAASKLTATGDTIVSNEGSAVLRVADGARADLANVRVGADLGLSGIPAGQGLLEVKGAGTLFTAGSLNVNQIVNGAQLTVADGGEVNLTALNINATAPTGPVNQSLPNSAIALVTGAGSRLTAQTITNDFELFVAAGAEVESTGNVASFHDIQVAGTGSRLVAGQNPGSKLTLNGFMAVTDGATVESVDAELRAKQVNPPAPLNAAQIGLSNTGSQWINSGSIAMLPSTLLQVATGGLVRSDSLTMNRAVIEVGSNSSRLELAQDLTVDGALTVLETGKVDAPNVLNKKGIGFVQARFWATCKMTASSIQLGFQPRYLRLGEHLANPRPGARS